MAFPLFFVGSNLMQIGKLCRHRIATPPKPFCPA
jgi:hypothetical protein